MSEKLEDIVAMDDIEPIDVEIASDLEELEKGQKNTAKITLPGGGELSYSNNKDSMLFADKLKMLHKSLSNSPCLPTEIIFPKQLDEALVLTRRYIEGIASIVDTIHSLGSNKNIESYSFRLPHMLDLEKWQNVVVRLQFASSFKIIKDTLNANLSSEATHTWDVLSTNAEGDFFIGGDKVKPGTKVDVFTTDEKVIGKAIFGDHQVVNCFNINGSYGPIIHMSKDELANLSTDDLDKRREAGIRDGEHLLGVDAWSFMHCLLYRISEDDEDVIVITTDILTRLDYDARIPYKEYISLAERLHSEGMPYGLNIFLLRDLRDHHCKSLESFKSFKDSVNYLYSTRTEFRLKLGSNKIVRDMINKDSFIITGIVDLLRLLDGESKVLRTKVLLYTGEVKDVVTITRPYSLTQFGTFNRFNPNKVIFNVIEYKDKIGNNGIISKLRGTSDTPLINDNFVILNETLDSSQVVGFINSSTKAYYFTPDSNVDVDDKFKMFHDLSKRFKRISKGLV